MHDERGAPRRVNASKCLQERGHAAPPRKRCVEKSIDFYVLMMRLPARRFFTGPLPPGLFAARFFAAVILPPLLFFAIMDAFCFVFWCLPSHGTLCDGLVQVYGV